MDKAELPFIGVSVLGRLVARSARPGNDGISAIVECYGLSLIRQELAKSGHLPDY